MKSYFKSLAQKIQPVWFWVLMAFSLMLTIVIIGAYAYHFYKNGTGGPQEWAWFGDYLGGLLNPALGLVSVVILAFALVYQTKEFKRAREEAKTERLLFLAQQVFAQFSEFQSQSVDLLIPEEYQSGRTNFSELDESFKLERVKFSALINARSPHFPFQMPTRKELEQLPGEDGENLWETRMDGELGRFLLRLTEMNSLLNQIDSYNESSEVAEFVAKYYAARMKDAAVAALKKGYLRKEEIGLLV